MSAQTPVELLKEIEAYFDVPLFNECEIVDGDSFAHWMRYAKNGQGFHDEVFDIEAVEEVGGEDCGSEYFWVFKISKTEYNNHIQEPITTVQYIKLEGIYDSWAGTEWGHYKPRFVTPVEKIVIAYEVIG